MGSKIGDWRAWLSEGIGDGTASVVGGWLISLVITALLALNVGWAVALEKRGIDLSMRWAVALMGPVTSNARGAAATPIVFLDIDEAGCERLAAEPGRCRSAGVVDPLLIHRLGEALARSKARLIVLDVVFPPPQPAPSIEMDQQAISVWADGPGPAVIVALPSTGGHGRNLVVEPGMYGALNRGRLSAAPAIVWSDVNSDAVVRNYPDRVDVVTSPDDGLPSEMTTLPTTAAARLGRLVQVGTDSPGDRIFFSLPTMVDSSARFAADYLGSYERRALSDMVEAPTCASCPPRILVQGLQDQLIVVGSSAPAAADRHLTPLGVMSGAEILANAIRAKQIFSDQQASHPLSGMIAKLLETLPAAALALGSAIAMAWIKARMAPSLASRVRGYVLIVGVYLVALGIAVVLSLASTMSALMSSFGEGHPVDLLIPTLSVFIGGFVEATAWVARSVSERTSTSVRHLLDRLSQTKGT